MFSASSTVECRGEEYFTCKCEKSIYFYTFIGLGLEWIVEPNVTVFLGESFNVSYKPTITANFYDNMAMSEYFPDMK